MTCGARCKSRPESLRAACRAVVRPKRRCNQPNNQSLSNLSALEPRFRYPSPWAQAGLFAAPDPRAAKRSKPEFYLPCFIDAAAQLGGCTQACSLGQLHWPIAMELRMVRPSAIQTGLNQFECFHKLCGGQHISATWKQAADQGFMKLGIGIRAAISDDGKLVIVIGGFHQR